ncbi:MAG TPA: TolC family protein, partial [Acidobacteriaceae bacterium]
NASPAAAPAPPTDAPDPGPIAPAPQISGNAISSTPAVLQVPATSSLFDPYYGSVQSRPARPEVLPLSLDDALRLGLENNLGLVYARQGEQQQHAQTLTLLNVLLPNVDVQGSHSLRQLNLEAQGFRPGLLAQLGPALGGGRSGAFPFLVKVNETEGQANLSQYLFNLAGYDAVRAFQHSERAARMSSSSSRGLVVLNVGTAYLRAVAAQSNLDNARTLLKTDEAVLYQSTEMHKAGVTANLDELRSRVQYQTQQQSVIAADNTLSKAKIALNRSIGLAPDQQVQLTDAAPYASLDTMQIEAALRQALATRQDYRSLLEQLRTAEYERKAATHERLPTLIFRSNYGITGTNGGVYHDTWQATGTLNIPVFEEARFRSDRDTADFQLQNLRARIANLEGQIDQQLRDSLVDLRTTAELVRVARSNVDLATTELEQSTQRFQAGVEDNLPVTQSQSTLAQAQTQYVTAVFQFNQARLSFARNLGLIDQGYLPSVEGGRPAGLKNGSHPGP